MSMSKKDFIALANTIREHNESSKNHPLAELGSELNPEPFTRAQLLTLARFQKSANSRFNTQRWMDYIAGQCGGPNGGAIKKSAATN